MLWSLATLIRTIETYVVHEYRADTFLRLLGKGDGAVSFSAIISYGGADFSKKFSSPPAMSYNKFCSVPDTIRYGIEMADAKKPKIV